MFSPNYSIMYIYPKVERYQASLRAARTRRLAEEQRKIFRFLDLPSEIRNMIYRLCLTSEKPSRIHHDDRYEHEHEHDDGDCELFRPRRGGKTGICMHLTSSIFSFLPRDYTVHAKLFRVCRRIYNEASPILYRSNAFQFLHPYSELDFTHFVFRLSKACRGSLREVFINFPAQRPRLRFSGLRRNTKRRNAPESTISYMKPGAFQDTNENQAPEFLEASERALAAFCRLPNLRNVIFRVREDVDDDDLELLRKIEATFPRCCNITILFDEVPVYAPSDTRTSKRANWVSERAVKAMLEWDWFIRGEWEVVEGCESGKQWAETKSCPPTRSPSLYIKREFSTVESLRSQQVCDGEECPTVATPIMSPVVGLWDAECESLYQF